MVARGQRAPARAASRPDPARGGEGHHAQRGHRAARAGVARRRPTAVLDSPGRAARGPARARSPACARPSDGARPNARCDVALDLGRLARLGLPLGRGARRRSAARASTFPAAVSRPGRRRFNVKTSGSYESLEQVGGDGRRRAAAALVRVRRRRAGRVGLRRLDLPRRATTAGARCSSPRSQQDGHEHRRRCATASGRRSTDFEATLPAGVTLERGFDQAANVSHRLSRLGDGLPDRDRARAPHAAAARVPGRAAS